MTQIWTRDPDRGCILYQLGRTLESIPAFSIFVRPFGNTNMCSCLHPGISSQPFPVSDYKQYYASVLSLRGLCPPPSQCPLSDPSWLSLYKDYLHRVLPYRPAPRPSLVAYSVREDRDFQDYNAHVLALSSTSSVQPFKRRNLYVGSPPVQIPLWDEEYLTYYHRVSVQTLRPPIPSSHRLRPSFIMQPPFAWSAQPFLLPPCSPTNGSVPSGPWGSVALGITAGFLSLSSRYLRGHPGNLSLRLDISSRSVPLPIL